MGFFHIHVCVLITGCLASVTHALLNITIPAKLNSDALLPCRLPMHSSAGVSVRWFSAKDGWLTSGNRVYKYNGQISIDKPAPNEWNLRIQKVSQSFADTYTCQTDTGTKVSVITLVIETPPKIEESGSSPTRVNFSEHSTASLTCALSGLPKPEVTWYRGTSENPIGISGPMLKIRDITRYATDVYICRAKNKYGEVERRINVTVNFAPEVTVMESEVYAAGGEVVVMSCAVQSSPLYDAYWTKGTNVDGNGAAIKPNWKYLVMEEQAGDGMPVRFITLIIRKAILASHDYGTYTCVARGEKQVAQDAVELKEKAAVEEEGQTVIKYD